MSTKNPWKTLKSEVVHENPWFRVRHDDVIRPDGKPGTYSVVDTRIATGVVALSPEGNVTLVGQYRYPTDMYSWEIVEGGTDGDEDALVAAKRELREEAGLIAKQWSPLGSELHLSNCISSEVGYLFLAEDLTETAPEPDGTEVLQVKHVPLSECIEMVLTGEIQDAFSIIGLFLADRELKRRARGGTE